MLFNLSKRNNNYDDFKAMEYINCSSNTLADRIAFNLQLKARDCKLDAQILAEQVQDYNEELTIETAYNNCFKEFNPLKEMISIEDIEDT